MVEVELGEYRVSFGYMGEIIIKIVVVKVRWFWFVLNFE